MELLVLLTPHLVIPNVTRWNLPLVIKHFLEFGHQFLPFLSKNYTLPIEIVPLETYLNINPFLINNGMRSRGWSCRERSYSILFRPIKIKSSTKDQRCPLEDEPYLLSCLWLAGLTCFTSCSNMSSWLPSSLVPLHGWCLWCQWFRLRSTWGSGQCDRFAL